MTMQKKSITQGKKKWADCSDGTGRDSSLKGCMEYLQERMGIIKGSSRDRTDIRVKVIVDWRQKTSLKKKKVLKSRTGDSAIAQTLCARSWVPEWRCNYFTSGFLESEEKNLSHGKGRSWDTPVLIAVV